MEFWNYSSVDNPENAHLSPGWLGNTFTINQSVDHQSNNSQLVDHQSMSRLTAGLTDGQQIDWWWTDWQFVWPLVNNLFYSTFIYTGSVGLTCINKDWMSNLLTNSQTNSQPVYHHAISWRSVKPAINLLTINQSMDHQSTVLPSIDQSVNMLTINQTISQAGDHQSN